MSFTVEIKGLRELQAKLKALPVQLKKEANGIVQRGAEVFIRGAQRDVPVRFGFLRGAINFAPNPVTNLQVRLAAWKKYAAYLEWGTITRVVVPAGLEPYAITFKGRGIRKNGGIFPHPFFFKQLPLAKKTIEQGFSSMLKDIKL